MRSNKGGAAVKRRAGILLATTAIGVLAGVTTVNAQENCVVFNDGQVQCSKPGDLDIFYNGFVNLGATGDGAYDNLEEKIAAATPTDADLAAAANAVAAAQTAADELADALATVNGSLTEDNAEAFAAVEQATADLTAAQQAQSDAGAQLADAQAGFNSAADDLTDANVALGAANATLTAAQANVAAASAAYDANQTPANLQALNDALAAQAQAQQAVTAATEDRNAALAAANEAAATLASSQAAFNDAAAATVAANAALNSANTTLSTSLAGNSDFVDAITDAGYTANAGGLAALSNDAQGAQDDLAAAQEFEENIDNAANTFMRAQEVLGAASENGNPAIAAAAQALIGDERAEETDFVVEAVAALVDHEGRITATEEGLVEEAATREAADLALGVRIDEEAATREAADLALGVRIDEEAATREAADLALGTRIDEEAEIRAAADVALANLIDEEADIRAAADVALQDAIVAETVRATEAETVLRNDLSSEVAARQAGDAQLLERFSAEETARIAADNALSTRVSALDGRVGTLETRVDRLEDKVASATATAIALGGAGFLPDMKFNLAMNFGFYEGAQAVSASLGYRVSNSVAITAGVAGGLNKNGKVGGRVGVIFGF